MKAILVLMTCQTTLLLAQVGPSLTSNSLTSTFQQTVAVAAGSTPTLVPLNIDAPPSGQDTIDVLVSDPNIVISILLPSGTEITAANASTNGFTFTTYTADGSGDSTDLLTPYTTAGTHTTIQLPMPAVTGEDLTRHTVLFWPVGAYLIIYRSDRAPIETVAVTQGSRDIPSFLRRRYS